MDSHKNKILSFYSENRRMPGYKEMMDMLGFKSKNAVYKVIQKLVEDGSVRKDARGRLTPMRMTGEVPLLGLVEAGFPAVAEQETLDTLNLDDYLIKNKEATYLLEVKGDSMIDAGIQEGDLVIAERRGEPRDGDIVIAELDGGWTMKYYRKRGATIFLEAANPKYKPMYPREDLRVAAIVRGVVRKY